MPKAFKNFDEDKTIENNCEKRPYATRQFINKNSLNEDATITDAEDLEVRDYTFEATSYPEAMGLMIGDMVQNYAYNMCVKVLELFATWFEQSGQILDNEDGLNKLEELGILPEDIEKTKEEIKNKWMDVQIPTGFAVKVLEGIVKELRDAPNLIHWQEPELMIMGNPNLVKNMKVQAETLSDLSKDGVKDIEQFLINFTSKKEEEE
tara:strand:+ start:419 stop:1039 length:621 start_codon:yes stop_codon:yes gene_type:complete